MDDNRIYFHGNPWPNGHKVKEFVWGGRLSTDGDLQFDFHLQTDNYYADDLSYDDEVENEDPDTGWESKGVWGNYHSCTLSSTKWHDGGWKVAGSKMPFVFSEYDGFFLHLDPAENTLLEDQDYSERAFHIYLMGHDAVADHQICFSKANNGTWNIGWTGKIAQVYIGDYDLDYRFSVNLTRVQFSGFTVPLQLSDDEACTLFEQSVSDFSQWKLLKDNKNSNHRFFLPIELS